MNRSTVRAGSFRRSVAALGVMSLIAFSAVLILAGPAAATPFTGGLSPTVINNLLDLNGDNEVTGADDSNAFYGDTAIINGALDCDAWSGPNGGEAGDGVIDANDDCQMIAYDGTVDGVTIDVVDGSVDWPDGSFPEVFNASDPDNPGVLESDFAWSTINGRVDSSGDETIDANDCSFDVIGTADILGNTLANTNPCGFANAPSAADNGKVDLNSDGNITAADTCEDGCFLGHNVTLGVVQVEGPQTEPPPSTAFSGTFGPTIINGGADLNGDAVVNGRDDSNAFFGDTSIIDVRRRRCCSRRRRTPSSLRNRRCGPRGWTRRRIGHSDARGSRRPAAADAGCAARPGCPSCNAGSLDRPPDCRRYICSWFCRSIATYTHGCVG